MPKSMITLYTQDGEVVTEFELGRTTRRAPYKVWSISRCMSIEEIQEEAWPKGVEAEVALLLVFYSHDVIRTTEAAKLLGRDVATVCRALHALSEKKWALHVSRGTWRINRSLVYHGKWGWLHKTWKTTC